jgi:tetratricopeptide (TPR) repeat protein
LSIFWIPAGSRERFEKDCAGIAKELNLIGHNDPEVDVLLLLKSALETEEYSEWMLIFDDVNNLKLFSKLSKDDLDLSGSCLGPQIFDYIPSDSKGSIIYTTRNKFNAIQLTSRGKIIPVGEMAAKDCMALFRTRLSGEISTEEGWEELLLQAENLPLAIVQACSFIRQNSWNCPQYIQHIRDRSSKPLVQFLLYDFHAKHRGEGISNSVMKIWIITIEHLEAQHPLAAELLWRTAYLDQQNIPRCLLDDSDRFQTPKEGSVDRRSSRLDFERAIRVLEAYSLISVTTKLSSSWNETYTIHRLVQLFSRRWLEIQKRIAGSKLADSIIRLHHSFPSDAQEREWQVCVNLLPHIESVITHQHLISAEQGRYCELLFNVSSYVRKRGNYSAAEDYLCRILAFSEKASTSATETDLEVVLGLKSGLASRMVCNGEYERAEEIQRKVVIESESLYGRDSRFSLGHSIRLGQILRHRGQLEEAEGVFRDTIEILKISDGVDDFYALHPKVELADTLKDTGKLDEAEEILRQVLLVTPRAGEPGKATQLRAMGSFASILSFKGQFDEVESIDRKLLEESRTLWGPDHPCTLRIMVNVGASLDALKRFSEAMDLFLHALFVQETRLGHDHVNTIRIVESIGRCLEGQGKFSEAVKYWQKGLESYERTYGVEHHETLQRQENLKRCLEKLRAPS